MKRTIFLLILTFVGFSSAMVMAQVMNKGEEVVLNKGPAKTTVTCPYCQRTMSLSSSKNHMNVCPYRFCIEYTYDAAGNRIQRSVVWTIAPIVKKKIELAETSKQGIQEETNSDQ